MASHEATAVTDEWFTPAWVFHDLGTKFDLDPCCAEVDCPARSHCRVCWHRHAELSSLNVKWWGSVWLNPPFGGRNGIRPWLEKFIEHGSGIALVPNRTATDWFQDWALDCDGLLFLRGKVKFLRSDGTEGRSPGYGNVFGAVGDEMVKALLASKLPGLRVTQNTGDVEEAREAER